MFAPLTLVLVLQGKEIRGVAEKNAAAFRFAILHRDAKWFERTFAPDFVQKTEAARLDRRTALAQIRSGLLRMKATSLTEKVSTVRSAGKGYVATIDWHGTMPATLQNRTTVLNVNWRDEQRWTPIKGRWVLRSLVTSHFERTIE